MAHKPHLHEAKRLPLQTKVLIGGFSSLLVGTSVAFGYEVLEYDFMATPLLHPLDVFKVRLQQLPKARGMTLIHNMLRYEGIRAPYTGMAAGILRQATFTTSRLGVYYCLHEYYKSSNGTLPGFWDKIHFSVYAGLVGAFVGCPFEIMLVRMAADGPLDPYRRYKGVIDAFNKICQREGVRNLWRGNILNCARSVIVTSIQIGTYAMFNKAKNFLVDKNLATGFGINLYISLVSSFAATVVSLPFDTIKTRFQLVNFAPIWDHYLWFRYEAGYSGMWRGFTPYYLRLTVNTLITFYLLDLLIQTKSFKPRREF